MLRRIKGQLEGVERMIEGDRHSPDILAQIRAVRGALKGLEATVLETRLRHFASDVLISSNVSQLNKKLEEFMELIKKR